MGGKGVLLWLANGRQPAARVSITDSRKKLGFREFLPSDAWNAQKFGYFSIELEGVLTENDDIH